MTTSSYQPSSFFQQFKTDIETLDTSLQDPLHNKLYFAHCITLMEKYLSDLFIHEVTTNRESLIKVGLLNKYKDQTIKVGYLLHNSVEDYIIDSLKKMLWHRINDADVLYKHVLGITFNKSRNLTTLINLRHDIVHRNGHDYDGNSINITDEKLACCVNEITSFTQDIDRKYQAIKQS